ncbi:MAG: hypothetical protein AB7G25_13740 [Sphingomonadaceae bacterium]
MGWTGAGLILLAYVLLSLDRLSARSRAYQGMNVRFIVNSGWNDAWPSVGLNVVWIAIGLYALWRIGRAPPRSRC